MEDAPHNITYNKNALPVYDGVKTENYTEEKMWNLAVSDASGGGNMKGWVFGNIQTSEGVELNLWKDGNSVDSVYGGNTKYGVIQWVEGAVYRWRDGGNRDFVAAVLQKN